MGEYDPNREREVLLAQNVARSIEAFENSQESLGGNAGKLRDGRKCGAFNFLYDPCSGEIVVFTNYEQAYPGHEKYLKGTFKVAWDLNMERHRAGQVLKTEIVRVDTPNNERDPMIDGTVLRINSYFEKLHQNEQNK